MTHPLTVNIPPAGSRGGVQHPPPKDYRQNGADTLLLAKTFKLAVNSCLSVDALVGIGAEGLQRLVGKLDSDTRRRAELAAVANVDPSQVNAPAAPPKCSTPDHYSPNQASYDLQFEEQARRTGQPRDSLRERVVTELADSGHHFYSLLGNSDAEVLSLYEEHLRANAEDEGETLRAASAFRTTVLGASQAALAHLGLAKLQQLKAQIDAATTATSATTSH
jgi:hypothetical protein